MKFLFTFSFLALLCFAGHAQFIPHIVGLHDKNGAGDTVRIASVDPATGTITDVFSKVPCANPYFASGFAIDTAKGLYYLKCGMTNSHIMGVSLLNGSTVTDVAIKSSTYLFGGLAFNHKDGKLYSLAGTPAQSNKLMLMSMDPATGNVQPVSGIQIGTGGTTLAGNAVIAEKENAYYCITIEFPDFFLTALDLTTGTVLHSKQLSFTANSIVDNFTRDRWSGKFYFALQRVVSGNLVSTIAVIDTATGTVTDITSPLPGTGNFMDACIDPQSHIYYIGRNGAFMGIDLKTGNLISQKNLNPDVYFMSYDVVWKLATSVPQITVVHPSISPNPAHGMVTVNYNEARSHTVTLLDATGRVVYTATDVKEQQLQINLSGYSKGTYLLRTETKDASYTDKLVIE